jgi:hypothetical protein
LETEEEEEIMAENLMNSEHKATNEKYREGYDRIFGKKIYHFGESTVEFNGPKDAFKYEGHTADNIFFDDYEE